MTECPGIVAYHRADIGCLAPNAILRGVRSNGMAERGRTNGKMAVVHLISNGWNGFGSDGREVGCTIKFFINLANEDDHVAFDEVEP
jgi:hypothetical protein